MLQPWSSAQLLTLTSTLIILDITKTESNNCLNISAKIRPFYKFPRDEYLHYHLEIINGTFAE